MLLPKLERRQSPLILASAAEKKRGKGGGVRKGCFICSCCQGKGEEEPRTKGIPLPLSCGKAG